jgi:hypothetical protein
MDAISDSTIEKIKQLVEAESTECVVTSPMDKLESFFIRTVAAAQEQAQPTSGAVSTTKIGEFLTGTEPMESILDKLVSAPVSEEASPEEKPVTEKVVPASGPQGESDAAFLSKLTRSVEPAVPEPVVKDEKAPPEPVEQEQVKENVLDKLTGRSSSERTHTEKTDKTQAGDSGDA